MNLSERKAFVISKATEKLNETDAVLFAEEVQATSSEEELKTVIEKYKPTDGGLAQMKTEADLYIGFLRDRGVDKSILTKTKTKMLEAETAEAFVNLYKTALGY